MNVIRTLLASVLVALALSAGAAAQDRPKAAAEPKPAVPVKILVVFSEFDGDKKINSMPYAFTGTATEDRSRYASLRMGLKVPILSGPKDQFGQVQMQYMDVGTDIDARVEPTTDNRFQINLQVRRSSIHTLEGSTVTTSEFSGRPVLRAFSSGFDFMVRDGQTVQTTMATDPVSGHVLKVDVTLNVVK